MKRWIPVALLLACAGLLAAVLYRSVAEQPRPALSPALSPESRTPTPQQGGLEDGPEPDRPERVLPRSAAPSEPIDQTGPAIVVRARHQGRVVRGGEVRLVSDRGSLQTQTFDESGTAVFEVGERTAEQVLVKVPGYVAVSRRLESSGPQTVEFSLLPAAVIRVRLVDNTGHLLANRQVQSRATAGVRSEPPNEVLKRSSGITNERGLALLDVPAGQHEVTVPQYSHWKEARSSVIEAYAGQSTEATLVVNEMPQSSYAGVLFPPLVISDVNYSDDGVVRDYRLFYRIGDYTRNVRLYREGDRGFVAVIPDLPIASVQGFIARCDNRAQVPSDAPKSRPFEIWNGATVTRIPEWEQ